MKVLRMKGNDHPLKKLFIVKQILINCCSVYFFRVQLKGYIKNWKITIRVLEVRWWKTDSSCNYVH